MVGSTMISAAPQKKLCPRYEGLRVTREEYLDLPDDGFIYDMIDGVLCMPPSGSFDHGEIQLSFGGALKTFLKINPAGRVSLETDILLPDGGDVLRPDISFVLKERAHIIKKHVHGTPDLVVETLSESTRERDRTVKADRYLKNGVKEYWLLDPEAKTMELWINRGNSWEKISGPVLKSRLLEGFEVRADEIFA